MAQDFGVAFTDEQKQKQDASYNYGSQQWKYGNTAPGLSVFCQQRQEPTNDGNEDSKTTTSKIYHTYSTYAAGLADLNVTFHLLDCIPEGRNETNNGNMYWVQHKEHYNKTQE